MNVKSNQVTPVIDDRVVRAEDQTNLKLVGNVTRRDNGLNANGKLIKLRNAVKRTYGGLFHH